MKLIRFICKKKKSQKESEKNLASAFQPRSYQNDSCVRTEAANHFFFFFGPRASPWNYSDLQDAGESAVNSYPVRCPLAQRMNSESCPAILPEAKAKSRDRSPLASRHLFIPGQTGGFFRGTNTHVRFICLRAGKEETGKRSVLPLLVLHPDALKAKVSG